MTRAQGVSRERFLQIVLASILVGAVLIGLKEVSGAATSANADEVGLAFIVPLFPQKEKDLKKGLPPGMTEYSFWAGRGTMALTKLATTRSRSCSTLRTDPLWGLYLWNVLETEPFKDEPLGEFGYGKHSVVADGIGKAHKVVAWINGRERVPAGLSRRRSAGIQGLPRALWGHSSGPTR
jgi:hypothetical protein